MNRRLLLLVSLFVLLVPTRVAFAQDEAPRICPICGVANDRTVGYPQQASSLLLRGIVNTAFGWTELLVQPTSEVNAGGNIATGIGKGIGHAVKRTAAGIGELLTFWIPKRKEDTTPPLATDCPICMTSLAPPGPGPPR